MSVEQTQTSRIRRFMSWSDEWMPWVDLIYYYLLYFTVVYSLVWSIWPSLPTTPLYTFIEGGDPRASVFIIGFLFWRVTKDAIRMKKPEVFEERGEAE